MTRAKKTLGAPNPGAPTQPLRVASGGSYGDRKQMVDAQRAMPLPGPGAAPGAAPAAPTRPGLSPDVLAKAAAFDPGDSAFNAPSQRPGESVTAGLDSPAAFTPPVAAPNPDVIAMARHLPMLEALASRPNSSATTRAFVRRLRSQLPADFDFNA